MSFTIDGHTIPTTPASILRLDCGNTMIVTGHKAPGTYVACDECALAKGPGAQTVTACLVTASVPTQLVEMDYS